MEVYGQNKPQDAEIWDSLCDFLRRKDIPTAPKLYYAVLWFRAGGRAGYVYGFTVKGLADAVGVAEKTAREHFERLRVEWQLVEVVLNKGGVMILYVYDYRDMVKRRPVQPDPQRELPFNATGVSAQKTPSDAGVSAQNTPWTIPFNGQQVQAGNELEGKLPREAAGVSAQKTPPAPHESIEQETIYSMGRTTEKASLTSTVHEGHEGGHISGALAGALERFMDYTDPPRRKNEIADEIRRRVNDPKMDATIPLKAAQQVLDGKIELEGLQEVLGKIDRTWQRERESPGCGFRTSSGAYFLYLMRDLCKANGVEWDKPKQK